jgi:hypothetical protein
MQRAVRSIIRLIAAGVIAIGILGLALEYARHRKGSADFSAWHCLRDSLAVALGAVLYAASSKLARRLAEDFDE